MYNKNQMKLIINAYVNMYNLIEMKNPHNRYRVWKNPNDKDMRYDENEIESYINDMDKNEIRVLISRIYSSEKTYNVWSNA